MKKALLNCLLAGIMVVGFSSCETDSPGGGIPDPEYLTKGFAACVEKGENRLVRYTLKLTDIDVSSVDETKGPGDVVYLDLMTENLADENYIALGDYIFEAGAEAKAGLIVASDNSKFGTVNEQDQESTLAIKSGTVNVYAKNGIYTIKGKLTNTENVEYDFVYEGALVFAARPAPPVGNYVTFSHLYSEYESWGMHNDGNRDKNHYLLRFTTPDYSATDKAGTMLQMDIYSWVKGFHDGIDEAYAELETERAPKSYTTAPMDTYNRAKINIVPDTKFFRKGLYGDEEIIITDGDMQVKRTGDIFTMWGWVVGPDAERLEFKYEGAIKHSKATIHLYDLNRFFLGYDWSCFKTPNKENDVWWIQMHNVAIYDRMFVNPPGDCFEIAITVPYTTDPVNALIPEGTYHYSSTGNELRSVVELNDPDKLLNVGTSFIDTWGSLNNHQFRSGSLTITHGSGTGTSKKYNLNGTFKLSGDVELVVLAENQIMPIQSAYMGETDLTGDLDLTGKLVEYDIYSYGERDDTPGLYNNYLYLGTEEFGFEGTGLWEPEFRNKHMVQLGFWTRYADGGIAKPGVTYIADTWYWDNAGVRIFNMDFDSFEWGDNLGVWGLGTQYNRHDEAVQAAMSGQPEGKGIKVEKSGNIWTIEFELYDDLLRKVPNVIKGNYVGEIDFDEAEWYSSAYVPVISSPRAGKKVDITKVIPESVKKSIRTQKIIGDSENYVRH